MTFWPQWPQIDIRAQRIGEGHKLMHMYESYDHAM